ncbi:class II fructose-bisphosphate aldolase [Spiroplasma gladiatoris]|uniref:Class II fructose-bisphosphate aldolase n=1 Tax=Spiroplasma gladiatoris TaxID=2143 RepID=A0A4P7AGA5_9MOLU|nr:class II fructose-bisphosphate aldolase [Spiroplasma gladiatoris]
MCDVGLIFKPFNQNVKETLEVVEYVKKHGVEVESEIGHVGVKEDYRNSSSNGYTDVKEALDFNKLTQIDALAIAIWTNHGLFKGKIKLQFELLEQLKQKIKTL